MKKKLCIRTCIWICFLLFAALGGIVTRLEWNKGNQSPNILETALWVILIIPMLAGLMQLLACALYWFTGEKRKSKSWETGVSAVLAVAMIFFSVATFFPFPVPGISVAGPPLFMFIAHGILAAFILWKVIYSIVFMLLDKLQSPPQEEAA